LEDDRGAEHQALEEGATVGFLNKLLTREPASKDIAKRRLQLVIVRDRQPLSPGLMQTMKNDIILVVSKYVEVDEENAQLTISQGAGHHRIVADIPVQGLGRRASS
jgi:cell division topological specificity factor